MVRSRLQGSLSKALGLLVIGGLLVSCQSTQVAAPVPDPVTPTPFNVPPETYVGPAPYGSFPADAATVQGWIDSQDMASIRAHGWDVWASITQPSGIDDWPVWETWYSGHEIFDAPFEENGYQRDGEVILRDFENPVQFFNETVDAHGIPLDPAERVTAFNRYTESVAEYIFEQGYNRAEVLDAINAEFTRNDTPIAERKIQTSPGEVDEYSIVLKPVFQFISGDAPTVVPFWNGDTLTATTSVTAPTVVSWRQGVVIDPTGQLEPGTYVDLPVNDEPPAPRLVVDLDQFYYIRLTAEEAAAFSQYALESGDEVGAGNLTDVESVGQMVQEGNIAVLMAMHVTTKEISNWTWQTFWWSPFPDEPGTGDDRPAAIPVPWSNYNMNTAYFMVTPADDPFGEPFVSYNPYLETNLVGSFVDDLGREVNWTGVTSNCMSCHRVAAWGANGNSPAYRPSGQIEPGDPLFAGTTKLDFLWSLTRAYPTPSAPAAP